MVLDKNQSGKLHGPYAYWFDNGQAEMSGEYNYGEKIGVWNYWFKDGALRIQKEHPLK